MALPTDAPAQPAQNPFQPDAVNPIVFEQFKGINTSTTRAGVANEQMYWSDGFFPIGPRQLRTIPDVGTTLYTAPGGTTIVKFFFYNIETQGYVAVLLSDGRVQQVNSDSGATTTLVIAGTINLPAINSFEFNQYGRQFLLFVNDQENGYWLWTGTFLCQAGTLGPLVTLTNPGSAYQTAPAVVASGGSGSGATFVASIAGGYVINVDVTNPGSGYKVGEVVLLTFVGGIAGGSGATFLAAVSGPVAGTSAALTATTTSTGTGDGETWHVTSVAIGAGGSGYSDFTTATVPTMTAPQRAAVLGLTITGGVITAVTILDPGVYFTSTAPVITVTDSGVYVVSSVAVTAGGTNYSPSTTLVVTGGNAAKIQATLIPVIAGGVITSVTVVDGGGYGGAVPVPTVTASDPAIVATATVELMPFGIKGTTIETYQGRVWIGDGATVNFTAPGSVADFSISGGGGNFISADSFLRVKYTKLIQTSGFLYLVADSSINYVSGVQTVGDPPVTTFVNQNADPEVGTASASAVMTLGRNVVFANTWGVHVIYGAAVTKVSKPLDGIYNSQEGAANELIPSMARATLFNKRVMVLLKTILDPLSGSQVHKLFLWDGENWFPASQSVTLKYIGTQEINSVLRAWGTTGTALFPLFSVAASYAKVFQTPLWDGPGGYEFFKTVSRIWGLIYVNSLTAVAFTMRLDNETNASNTYSLTPAATGYYTIPPLAVGQAGVLNGITFQTNAADLSVVSLKLQTRPFDYRG